MEIENNSDYLRVLPLDKQNPYRAPSTLTCKCLLCGGEKDIPKRHLRKAIVQSCGCLPRYKPTRDYTGEVINGARALGYVSSGQYKFLHTECGHSGIYPVGQIKGRKSASKCRDCWVATKIPWNKRHGKSRGQDRTYSSWLSMRRRCYEPTNNRYYIYGARGIGVCEQWRDSFDKFLSDMGECPEGCSLDRIDGNADYTPENCRWASAIQQSLNRTITWKFKIGGEWLSMRGACRNTGLDYKNSHYRIKTKGESPKDVFGDVLEDVIEPYKPYEKIKEE